jgi:two-component system OmpR family sensor kinase
MNPLRSVGARLSLALAVVVAAALSIVYVGLVPPLERRLVDAKVKQLEHWVPRLRQQYAASPYDPDFTSSANFLADARAVLFRPLSRSPLTLQVVQDSRQGAAASDVEDDPLALAVARTGRLQRGTVERGERRYAEVAFPLDATGDELLLSSSLESSLADVALIRRRIIWAGLIALAASVAVGFGAALLFARRIRRLERAADRIAGGDFTQPVGDCGRDELGQLAGAFERMRARLAQLDDARRAFIASASHELRTPLFSLGGFLELLQDEDLDEETRQEFFATMSEQVDRLTRLATDLLDLSRLDAGRLRVDREPVELAPLAQVLAEEFAAVAQRGSHPLDVVVEDDAATLADPQHVLRIGRVLLENALVHTPPGTPVRVVVRAPAELAVEDAGPGIPAEAAGRVFERFTRLDGARASGSGLGLAIARELAALMGGSIRLESAPGRTVFVLALPVASLEEREPAGLRV